MIKTVKRFYFTVLALLLVLSAYPVFMGVKIIVLMTLNGSVRPEDYARYVIPYAAVCISILVTAALLPLLHKLKRFAVLSASVLASGLFLGIELYIENITLNSPLWKNALIMQLYSCIGTTAAQRAFQKYYDNSFKIHYFLISFIIVLLVTALVYGYSRLAASEKKDRTEKRMLLLQLVCFILFIVMCVVANFTGFFRETLEYLSPISSILTSSFFIILGVTFGVYIGGFTLGTSKFMTYGLPSITAIAACSVMYYGEYKMLDGVLYRFGYSNMFQPLPFSAVSPVDILVILASGALTFLLMYTIWRSKNIIKGRHYRRNLTS